MAYHTIQGDFASARARLAPKVSVKPCATRHSPGCAVCGRAMRDLCMLSGGALLLAGQSEADSGFYIEGPPGLGNEQVSLSCMQKQGGREGARHAQDKDQYGEGFLIPPWRPRNHLAPPPRAASHTYSSAAAGEAELKTNFVSDKPSSWFSEMYKRDGLTGGHVIMLGSDDASK